MFAFLQLVLKVKHLIGWHVFKCSSSCLFCWWVDVNWTSVPLLVCHAWCLIFLSLFQFFSMPNPVMIMRHNSCTLNTVLWLTICDRWTVTQTNDLLSYHMMIMLQNSGHNYDRWRKESNTVDYKTSRTFCQRLRKAGQYLLIVSCLTTFCMKSQLRGGHFSVQHYMLLARLG